MAPKSKRSDKTSADVFYDDVSDDGSADDAKTTVNLGDVNSMKRMLDDAVVEALEEASCKIHHWIVDLKIILGIAACAVALAAQFWPGKHTDNFWLLCGCVTIYSAISTILTLLSALVEKDSIALTHATPVRLPLRIASRLPRHSDQYTLQIAPRSSQGEDAGVSCTASMGDYFHSDGHLCAQAIKDAAKRLLVTYDRESAKSK